LADGGFRFALYVILSFYANLLVMENIVLRDQIVKKLSKDFSISQARSKVMVEMLESIIAHELKTKSRIKIANFGTFVVKTRASRTVKTVREQKTKIILEQEVIRFIAAEQFKNQLMMLLYVHHIKYFQLQV